MARQQWMQRFARWHIWLGWLVGVPIVMWMVTGLVMVARPIDEVRGNHLRKPVAEVALPADTNIAISLPRSDDGPVRSVSTAMRGDQPITSIEYVSGTIRRFAPDGTQLRPVGEIEARLIVADAIIGGDKLASTTFFAADDVPFDFRRPVAVWQVALQDGTIVYVAQDTGKIEAVRTQWWRLFDFMWGLHIMDLETREDTSHPILILFAALGLTGSLLGAVLMFRRRKAKVRM